MEKFDGETGVEVQGEDRGEGSRGGGGDHSAGGRAEVFWNAGAGADTGDDQWISVSFVAIAMRNAAHDAGEQDPARGRGRSAGRYGGRADGAGRRGTDGGGAGGLEEGVGEK